MKLHIILSLLLLFTASCSNVNKPNPHANRNPAAVGILTANGFAVMLGAFMVVSTGVVGGISYYNSKGMETQAKVMAAYITATGLVFLDGPEPSLANLTKEQIKAAKLTRDEAKAYKREREFLEARLKDVARGLDKEIESPEVAKALASPAVEELSPDTQSAMRKLAEYALKQQNQ